jgi:twitching motility protein PilT
MAQELDYDKLLRQVVSAGASDLHVRPQLPPMMRVNGALVPMEGYGTSSPEEVETLMTTLFTPERKEQFFTQKSADFSHHVPDCGRFRVAFFHERQGWGCVLRQIPERIPRLDELGAPRAILPLSRLPRGLVLVTGPTGSGKSTTLAALVDVINRERDDHVLTVEDPIEFVHNYQRCVITQREVGEDTPSFKQALRDGLRQDPDVILVGEMRDNETMEIAITAAETGHLVLATLHTSSAPDTINRIIGVFPDGQQAQIRTQLSSALVAIICQSLLPTVDGKGRVAAHEVLLANNAVRAAIRDSKMASVRTTMQTSGAVGMQTMDKSLVDLVARGLVDGNVARERSQNQKEFDQLLETVRRGGRIDLPPKVTADDLVTSMDSDAASMPAVMSSQPAAVAPTPMTEPPAVAAPMPSTPAPMPTTPAPMPASAPQPMPAVPAAPEPMSAAPTPVAPATPFAPAAVPPAGEDVPAGAISMSPTFADDEDEDSPRPPTPPRFAA